MAASGGAPVSNKSGISSQVISLPQGGGALHGLGETFSPDLQTGTGNFSVPIALPSGRNGFQPQLRLGYSTGSGNGPFGLGWSVSIPGVSRKTSQGVPLYEDANDTFILSGAEDLIPTSVLGQTPRVTRYRPRTEGLFARIDHYHDLDNDFWEVRSKDGLISRYGTPASAGTDPAVVADPADPSRVFAWKLTRTTDPFGNHIDYAYDRDRTASQGPKEPHRWDQLYLHEIRYVDVDQASPQNPHFLITVAFHYEDRPDPFSDYRAGFEIRTRQRCTAIEIFTHPGMDILTRTYHLVYLDQRTDLSPDQLTRRLPLNGVSLLSEALVEGHDGAQSEWLPPLEFGYTPFDPEQRRFFPLTGPDLPSGSLGRPEYELADLLGNGLPDVLEMNGTVRYWRNLGGGRFDWPREMREAPAGLRLADAGVQLLDANGDGRIDLLATIDGLTGYFPLRFGGLWDHRSFQRYRAAPSFDLKDPEVKLVDLDGDGVTDAIRSGTRLECYFNDPHDGWGATRWVERQSLDVFPNVTFSDPRVKWADMTGDGLQDIVLVHDGLIEYWPSLGRGAWGQRIAMRKSPRLPWGYDPKRILLGDVDGDGLADLVYVEDTCVTLWINQSGNQWSTPIHIEGTPPISDLDAVRLVDLCGNGVSGVLWSADASELPRTGIFFLDFTGGAKPYLLSEMDNHLGATTRVGYAPSTRFYLEDEQHAATRWKTSLPFPVQVVARTEVIDAISGGKLTTDYHYHHGYWDGAEREFRGFGRVDHWDTEVFDDFHAVGLHGPNHGFNSVPAQQFSPPTETRTWFHQGPIGDEFGEWEETDFSAEYWPGDPQALVRPPDIVTFLKTLPRRVKRDALRTLRGRILRTELYALDGSARQDRPYTVTEHLHGVREVAKPGQGEPEDRPHIFFPYTLAERTTQWERGADPLTQLTLTGEYDPYGQPLSKTSIAVPRGRDFRAPTQRSESYLATYTETVYAQRDDAQAYLIDRAATATTYEILNDGRSPLFDNDGAPAPFLRDAAQPGAPSRRIAGQALNFYDGPAFQGLALGQIGDSGALTRTETLILTADILQTAYGRVPPYLATNGPPPWTPDYSQAFRDLLPPLAGYIYRPATAQNEAGYFAATEQRRYDFHDSQQGTGQGLITVRRDPLGHDTAVAYDDYDLLPKSVTDPAGLTTHATYDYRVLQPSEVTDPNGNRAAYTFTPQGLLESTAVMGKSGEVVGDTLNQPGTRLLYDVTAFDDRGQPISVQTTQRVHHVSEMDIPLPERDETIEKIDYSDGFGRLLQTRTQAEDLVFGDLIFGDVGLPADQSAPVGAAVGQARALSAPPRVVVSGWQVYDNKGQVIEKYEPFFSTGWDYAKPADAECGQKALLFYDPRGHVVRTINPDSSEQRVVHGAPGSIAAPDLTTPDIFEPTPWEAFTYDANDNAGRTHPTTATDYQSHWNTPSSVVVDALGRMIEAVERNGPTPATDWYITRSTYDIRGNLLTVADPLGRVAFRHVYDLAPKARMLRVEQLDAGARQTMVDAAGDPIEQRGSKESLGLRAYDVLNRPIRLWARDGTDLSLTLREHLIYGDSSDVGLSATQAAASNLLGRPYQHYDEAGLQTFAAYDFKGNALEKARQAIADAQLLQVFAGPPPNWQAPAFQMDWQPPQGTPLATYATQLLDAAAYQTTLAYDALNRVKLLRSPQDVTGARKELALRYNRAGALEQVELDGTSFVAWIAYNAKGQRTLIAYGNGVMTRHAYDPWTFRLARLRTERYTTANLTYQPVGDALQDLAYAYDLAGNILGIQDRTPGGGVRNNPDAGRAQDPVLAQLLAAGDALLREFAYDPLYRLLAATGRECADIPIPRPWTDDSRCGFNAGKQGTPNQDNAPDLTALYREEYTYDPTGNMLTMAHRTNGAAWTRFFGIGGLTPQQWSQEWPKHLGGASGWQNPPGNRLTHVGDNTLVVPATHAYDANGNLIQETTARHFAWDHGDHLRAYWTQAGTSEPSVYALYLYDAGGQRVKKLVRKQGGQVEVTVYVDGLFEFHQLVQGNTVLANNTLHVMDDQKRIAEVRVGGPFPDDTSPAVRFDLGDHLGNSALVIDDVGGWVNREEYTPYGETSFGGFARKCYRYTCKERDEESGLYYHGARYYAPWLGRWTSADPAGMADGSNLYRYGRDNPLRFRDVTGRDSGSPPDAPKPPPTTAKDRPSQGRLPQGKPPKVQQAAKPTGHQQTETDWPTRNPATAHTSADRLPEITKYLKMIEGFENPFVKKDGGVLKAFKAYDIKLEWKLLDGEYYPNTHEIHLNPNKHSVQNAVLMIHELTHAEYAWQHTYGPEGADDLPQNEYVNRKLREEAFAYSRAIEVKIELEKALSGDTVALSALKFELLGPSLQKDKPFVEEIYKAAIEGHKDPQAAMFAGRDAVFKAVGQVAAGGGQNYRQRFEAEWKKAHAQP
jgi:RHS repeat-associated protein